MIGFAQAPEQLLRLAKPVNVALQYSRPGLAAIAEPWQSNTPLVRRIGTGQPLGAS
ncbi:MAG: hypothetical protein ACLQJR_16785 [Stellaceae bacterium]